MLKRLQVKNYVLIDSLEITFPEGLVIITGQTGAGKSILLGSISLVLGAKADASAIGESGDKCVVEAEFNVPSDSSALSALLERNDVEWDDGHLILRRVIGRSGRPRAFVNDSPVSASVLSALSAELIDIHSQHQTLLLSDRRFQMSVLDHFAGNADLLKKCSSAYSEYLSLKSELEELDGRIARIEDERDYNEARFRQLDDASLKEGELGLLEEEQKQLANAEDIKENLFAVEDLFSPEAGTDRMPLDAVLRESEKRLEKISSFLSSASALAERISSCRVELGDILSDVSDMNSGIEVSQSRLQEVEERISLIYGLMQKFSCKTVGELIAVRDELNEALYDSSVLEMRRDELMRSFKLKKEELDALAAQLHSARVKAAPGLAESIQKSIRSLEMQYAVFEVEVNDAALSASGTDSIVFKFSSTGRNAVDLSKCASGGEMSRIMLCLKDLMARYTNMPTMIFDEIDTGVSGSVADKMGSMICSMGENMQVFAITHLPQVAAKGEAHYLVSKDVDPESLKTVTTIKKLSDEERVLELARMLSGSTLTDAAVANAKDLLGFR